MGNLGKLVCPPILNLTYPNLQIQLLPGFTGPRDAQSGHECTVDAVDLLPVLLEIASL